MAYIDPTEVSAANYKTLWEEGNRRVVEMTLKAGDSDIQHSHPNEVVYFITGGKVRITLENGESMEAELPDGHVMDHEPWTHQVTNIGTTDVRAIIYETK
ncbi:MAG: cupin domain-containing protein [Dehalococcoidia bacterium]